MIIWHNHHLIPRHMGGSDDSSNLLRCNTAMHSFLHKILYEQYGYEYDRIAWLGLSGQIGQDEVIILLNKENGVKSQRDQKGIFDPKNKQKIKHDHIINRDHRGQLNPQYGTIWITNGTNSKKIKKNSSIPFGYRKGRVSSSLFQKGNQYARYARWQ